MKIALLFFITSLAFCACFNGPKKETVLAEPSSLIGTWKLVSATTIKGTDTTNTDYTRGQEMIKIITPTHFSFLRHDLTNGKDSSAVFVAGGGRVELGEKKYMELLDYCNFREWEGGKFELNYTISNDTLVTTALEKVEKAGVDQLNIERLVRVK